MQNSPTKRSLTPFALRNGAQSIPIAPKTVSNLGLDLDALTRGLTLSKCLTVIKEAPAVIKVPVKK
jgi:hypothetical protein